MSRVIPKEKKRNYRKVLLDVPIDLAVDVKMESVRRRTKYYLYLVECIKAGHEYLKGQPLEIDEAA